MDRAAPTRIARFAIPIAGLLTLWPQVSAPAALALGLSLSLALGNPWAGTTRPWIHRLLSLSVIGLGAGMDLGAVGRAGLQGFAYTVVGISATLVFGFFLARALRIE